MNAALSGRLDRVIGEALVDTAFQPIVDLELGRIAGLEALTRPAPPSGFANPGELFDAAATLDRLWDLEAVTRRAALRGAEAGDRAVLLFLNCSPQVFADGRFAADLSDSLARVPGLTPARMVLEITERSEQLHFEALADQVARLKDAGFQIAIDDVGAGTSGLTRIMRLRPHWLKLDRDLIEWIDRDRVKQNMIRFLVHFARLSGVRVVAEGVERERELATLVDLGVTCAQGFYLGRPGGRDQTLSPEVADWLAKRCAAARTKTAGEPLGNRIVRLTRPALTVQAADPIRSIAARLMDDRAAPGAVVMRADRLLGWCRRRDVLERGGDGAPIESITPPAPAPLDPHATLTDALDIAGARDDQTFSDPLIIAGAGRVHGIVFLRDLLAAAAEVARSPIARTDPVTGLPGRVRADEHVARLIAAGRTGQPTAVAAIDLIRFSEFNASYGYELGDRLLMDLCNLIQLTIGRGEGVFIAHLGDDRFLVTAAPDLLAGRITVLGQQFDRVIEGYTQGLILDSGDRAPGGAPPPSGIGLRVVLVDNVLDRVARVRDLHEFARQAKATGATPAGAGPRFVIIRGTDPQNRAKAA